MKSIASVCVAVSLSCLSVAAQSLPQVDLGYEIHQAIGFNDTANYYNFSNIRYAQPPVGLLRFSPPVPPVGRNPVVQNGSFSPVCPQASPAWQAIGSEFMVAFAEGNQTEFNYTAAVAALAAQPMSTYTPSPSETEDCLFLDVIVPKHIFDNANNRHRRRSGAGAPVLVWIYGGGYTLGSKSGGGSYNPAGLLETAQRNGSTGFVFVAMNYRLGAMGWLSGPTLQQAGGVSNAALYDQRLAIEWVRDNIAKFGGDPNQVTLMGESAGGGSIMHQITAFGGKKGVSFQRAIPQSPGWSPITSTYVQDNTTARFLKNLNVSTIAEARNASSAAVIAANLLTVGESSYGQYSFGPVVDGDFVPTQPGLALLNPGNFAPNISIMAGHNTNEGPLFTPPYVRTNADLAAYIQIAFPTAPAAVVNYIINVLYPPIYDGSYDYTSGIDRTILIITNLIFTCNTHYLATAYRNQTYNYQFEVFPALHGVDVSSTFYNGQPANFATGLYPPVARALQTYISNFVMTGNPNAPDLGSLPGFPIQGAGALQLGLNYTVVNGTSVIPNIEVQKDPTSSQRCNWFQKGYEL